MLDVVEEKKQRICMTHIFVPILVLGYEALFQRVYSNPRNLYGKSGIFRYLAFTSPEDIFELIDVSRSSTELTLS